MAQSILLIDDEEIFVRMYQKFLENNSFTVSTAGDGQEGLKKALEEHPDLILLDIYMPKMDGMAMLKELRNDAWGKTARVIVLTNFDPNDEVLKDINQYAPVHFLLKAGNRPVKVLEHIHNVLKESE